MFFLVLRVGFRWVLNVIRRYVLLIVNLGMFFVYLIIMCLCGEGCRYCGFYGCM